MSDFVEFDSTFQQICVKQIIERQHEIVKQGSRPNLQLQEAFLRYRTARADGDPVEEREALLSVGATVLALLERLS